MSDYELKRNPDLIERKQVEDAITEMRSKATVRLGTKKYIELSEIERIINKHTGVSE